ncbi:MAG: peptide MFS transporter [Thermoanaerobaculia bacterium]
MTDTAAAPTGRVRHPNGLYTLFLTEMWERFSYYGMRAFLILYMVAPITAGGLGFDIKHGASVYGTYTFGVWTSAILGGIIADRWLGQYRSVLWGGIIIALGHFTLAYEALWAFYAGLALIVAGTGLLKPNVSTMVGSLYEENDVRRDAGFSIFYMGINLGATLGPLIAGYFAQKVNWHAGFACAGFGMTLGLIQYVLGRKRLKPALDRLNADRDEVVTEPRSGEVVGPEPVVEMARGKQEIRPDTGLFGFTPVEWKRLGAMLILFVFAMVFWGAYEQAGSTLNLFADRYTRLSVFGWTFPSSWFQSVPSLFVIIMAPMFAWMWIRLGKREPSTPAKFAFGLLFVGVAFLFLVPAASTAQTGGGIRVSPWWLVGCYFIQELGELALSPVGLSAFTKLSPIKIVGMMMGVWFLADAIGNKIAGYAAGFFASVALSQLFALIGGVAVVTSIVAFILIRPIRKLMGGVH